MRGLERTRRAGARSDIVQDRGYSTCLGYDSVLSRQDSFPYVRKLCLEFRRSLPRKANITPDRQQRCFRSTNGKPVKDLNLGGKSFGAWGTDKLLALTAAIRLILCSSSCPLALLTLDLFRAQALRRVRVEPTALLSSCICISWSKSLSVSLALERAVVIMVGREKAGWFSISFTTLANCSTCS